MTPPGPASKRSSPVQSDFRKRFAENLKRERKEARLSQRELGIRADVSRYYIFEIEKGIANATLDVVATLAIALGKDPIELLIDDLGTKIRSAHPTTQAPTATLSPQPTANEASTSLPNRPSAKEEAPVEPYPDRLRVLLARILVNARTAAGLSQRALAAQAGISQKLISHLEAAKTNVTLNTVTIIACALGIDPRDLTR